MNQYEVYPGKPPDLFLQEFFQSKQITIEAFCKNERLNPMEFQRMAREVVTEWELTEATHREYKDALIHLINHIRIKQRNEQRNNYPQRSQPSGRGQHRNPTTLDLAQAILARSSGSGN